MQCDSDHPEQSNHYLIELRHISSFKAYDISQLYLDFLGLQCITGE